MVDKPGRRKKAKRPWGKAAAAGVVIILVVAAGYYVYETYIYRAPPIYAVINTTDGPISVVLYPGCAPATVANIVSLARSGFYDDLAWHRIVPGFVIQTGDPHTRGGLDDTRVSWGEGFSNTTGLTSSDLAADGTVPLEVSRCPNLGTFQGYLAMARAGNLTSGFDTGTTQFFVNLANSTDNLRISGYYTVFGKVLSGWSVVQAIASPSNVCKSPTCPGSWPAGEPIHPVFVTGIEILETAGASSTTATTS